MSICNSINVLMITNGLVCQRTVNLENRNGDRVDGLANPEKYFFKRLITNLGLFAAKKRGSDLLLKKKRIH